MPRLVIMMGTDNRALADAVHSERRGFVDPAAPRDQWPVIHLFPEVFDGRPTHPSKHGAVADQCVASLTTVPRLILCTHSDVFVLRVRQHVADGRLKPEDVLLVWVEEDGTEKPIPLNDRGTPAWWPKVNGVPVFAEPATEFNALRRALNARDEQKGDTT